MTCDMEDLGPPTSVIGTLFHYTTFSLIMLQCEHPDTSDEDFGCKLYWAETGCKSIMGERYVKCPDSEQCVKDISQCTIVTPSEGGEGPQAMIPSLTHSAEQNLYSLPVFVYVRLVFVCISLVSIGICRRK